jgi:phosphopantetheine--protein transferase-like protein
VTKRATVKWLEVRDDFPTQGTLTLLRIFEKRKAGSFKLEVDRQAYCAAHGLLRLAIAERYGPIPFDLHYCANGKPLIESPKLGKLDLSISHARGLAAVGLFDGGRIGVDIENANRHLAVEEVAPRAFSAPEQAALDLATTPADRHEQFLSLWTIKEAIIKATGQGLEADLRSFTLTLKPLELLTSPGMVCLQVRAVVCNSRDAPAAMRARLLLRSCRAPPDPKQRLDALSDARAFFFGWHPLTSGRGAPTYLTSKCYGAPRRMGCRRV